MNIFYEDHVKKQILLCTKAFSTFWKSDLVFHPKWGSFDLRFYWDKHSEDFKNNAPNVY